MSRPLQTAAIDKWIDAPTRRVDAAGATFAYRRLGPATGVPVILLNHWGAVLDNFDPRIVDGLAATRPVIAVNYRGVVHRAARRRSRWQRWPRTRSPLSVR